MVGAAALFLRVVVPSVVAWMFLFEHASVLGFDHLVEELAKDFLGANRKGLLPSAGQSDELDAAVFGHDVFLNEFVLGAASHLRKTEFKVDLALDLLLELVALDALRVHLQESEDDLNELGQLLAVVDHLPRRAVLDLL